VPPKGALSLADLSIFWFKRGESNNMSYILVVDDDSSTRLLYRVNLEHRGYRVEEAATGQAAIEQVQKQKPRLMILDVKLPDMDGWTLLDHMAQYEDLKSIPAIVLTASLTEELTEKISIRPNSAEKLYKPFEIEDLIAKVKGVDASI
jgi:CheY-like chemotaxis protein